MIKANKQTNTNSGIKCDPCSDNKILRFTNYAFHLGNCVGHYGLNNIQKEKLIITNRHKNSTTYTYITRTPVVVFIFTVSQ